MGDSSVGIYGKNGSKISNKGTITVENASAGLMTSGSGAFVQNSGTINLNNGSGNVGIYVLDVASTTDIVGGNYYTIVAVNLKIPVSHHAHVLR